MYTMVGLKIFLVAVALVVEDGVHSCTLRNYKVLHSSPETTSVDQQVTVEDSASYGRKPNISRFLEMHYGPYQYSEQGKHIDIPLVDKNVIPLPDLSSQVPNFNVELDNDPDYLKHVISMLLTQSAVPISTPASVLVPAVAAVPAVPASSAVPAVPASSAVPAVPAVPASSAASAESEVSYPVVPHPVDSRPSPAIEITVVTDPQPVASNPVAADVPVIVAEPLATAPGPDVAPPDPSNASEPVTTASPPAQTTAAPIIP